jgi:fumarate reductase subunit D
VVAVTRWLHAVEPLIWPIFGAGFFAVAFVFPSFAAVVGLCDLAGWLPADALSFERVLGFAATPLGRLVLAGAIVLPLWNGAFHLRHTAMDLLGTSSDRFVGPVLYTVAALGSLAAGVVIWGL